jgi:hypothetical protein
MLFEESQSFRNGFGPEILKGRRNHRSPLPL